MNELLSMLVAIDMLASDLHYQAKGLSFYNLHLLADKCKERLNDLSDELKENYFLGELKTIAPNASKIARVAIEYVDNTNYQSDSPSGNKRILGRLHAIHEIAIHQIENMKKNEAFLSGTLSALDSISAKLQTNVALLTRSLEEE